MNELIIGLIAILSNGATGFFTFFFTKSRYKVDVLQAQENAETTAIENDIKLSGHYKEILDDLKGRYEKRYQEFEEMMNRKISLLEDEIKIRDRKIKLLQAEILELKKENRLLRSHGNNNSK